MSCTEYDRIHAGPANAGRGFFAGLAEWARWHLAMRMRCARARRELRQLGEHQLQDVGLRRGEVEPFSLRDLRDEIDLLRLGPRR